MLRIVLLCLLVLSACSSKHADTQPVAKTLNQGSGDVVLNATPGSTKIAPAIRNFVCERLHAENEKAPCEPEYTDVGELHTHMARITVSGQTVACAINSQQVSVVCGPLFYAPSPPAPPPAAVFDKATAPEPKKK